MSDTEVALMSNLLMSMIPNEDTEPPEGLLQLAADFWITNYRHVNSKVAVPLLSHHALPPETAERMVKIGSGSTELLGAYLTRSDPVDVMARQIAAVDPAALCLVVRYLKNFRSEVAELLADVDDGEMLVLLGENQHAPFLTRVRALKRAHNMSSPTRQSHKDHKEEAVRAAKELFKHRRLDDGAEVADALRLLQDTPELLSAFEQTLSAKTTVLTDEAVALLRWSSNLANRRSGWRSCDGTRPAVFNYLNRRFGMHAPSWDMFAKLASPDLRIGEIADLVLEVETSDS